MSEAAAPREWRAWLTAEAPSSRLHARFVRGYATVRIFLRNPLALAGLALVVALLGVAAAAPLLAHGDPVAQDLTRRLRPPSAAYWFGTDELGRDIYTRILYGARITLGIVSLVVVIVAPIGLLVGCLAGYLGGIVDTLLMRVTDVFLAFPRLILALAFVAALGPGIENAVIAIS
ncbi:MAG TPA: D,D-dipeptide ABC transporter permease, partial [Stellaceae bacterium]|nr:D,D-dipeptide ABC transporter permease [Stellaceae bacterium]